MKKKDILDIIILVMSFVTVFGGIAVLWRGQTTGAIIAGLYMVSLGLLGGYAEVEKMES